VLVELNTTATWQFVGAVSVPVHELPLMVNAAGLDVEGGTVVPDAPIVTEENVTEPDPVMLTITDCAALVAGEVPVGIPKARLLGATLIDACVCACDVPDQSRSATPHKTKFSALLSKSPDKQCTGILPPP
jgi:hypothetical protein